MLVMFDGTEPRASETRLSHCSSYYISSLAFCGCVCRRIGHMREPGSFGTARNSEASLSASRSYGETSIGPPRSKRSCHRNALSAGKSRFEEILVHVMT